jgi:hypothetical protein
MRTEKDIIELMCDWVAEASSSIQDELEEHEYRIREIKTEIEFAKGYLCACEDFKAQLYHEYGNFSQINKNKSGCCSVHTGTPYECED